MTSNFSEGKAEYREMILAAAFDKYATVAAVTPITEIMAPMTYPAFVRVENFYASTRTLDLAPIVARRILAGLVLPDRDALAPAVSEQEFYQAYTRFLEAGGRVVDALAIHGTQDTRGGHDGASWRRVCPSSPWPEQALTALTEAQGVASEFAAVWLAYRLQVAV